VPDERITSQPPPLLPLAVCEHQREPTNPAVPSTDDARHRLAFRLGLAGVVVAVVLAFWAGYHFRPAADPPAAPQPVNGAAAPQFREPARPVADEQPVAATVYVTKTGKKYHRGSCSYLRQSKIPTSLDDATKNGYTPCSRCNP
jgi:hypothetical protein